MAFKIDDDIEIPSAGGRGPRIDYPFLQMKVGQSIFVPNMTAKKMSGQVGFWKKQHGMNFAIRASVEDYVDDDGEVIEKNEGVRVWVQDPSAKSNRGRKPTTAAPAAEKAPAKPAADKAPAKPAGDKKGGDKKAAAKPAATEY